jgi:hypothetical protein
MQLKLVSRSEQGQGDALGKNSLPNDDFSAYLCLAFLNLTC